VSPPAVVLRITDFRWKKKNNIIELDDRKLILHELGKQKHNQQNLHIIGGMQPNYLGVYSPHPLQVCYH